MSTLRHLVCAAAVLASALLISGCEGPKIDISKSPKAGAAGLGHPKVPTAPPVGDNPPKAGKAESG